MGRNNDRPDPELHKDHQKIHYPLHQQQGPGSKTRRRSLFPVLSKNQTHHQKQQA